MAAIADLKRDMERPIPMDRLLCGDVGYGKTEVAMRAAFKAMMDRKAGGHTCADDGTGISALRNFEAKIRGVSNGHSDAEQIPNGGGAKSFDCRD